MPAEPVARFPNPDQAARLVLYPITGGGVAIEWLVEPALVELARAAFGGQRPFAKLHLRRADQAGMRLAEAVLADLDDNRSGRMLLQQPLLGLLQAELGLEAKSGGGWLLLARSNQLEAVPESLPLAAKLAATLAKAVALASAAKHANVGAIANAMAPADAMAPENATAPASARVQLNRSRADTAVTETAAPSLNHAIPEQQAAPPAAKTRAAMPRTPTRFPDRSLASIDESPALRGVAFPLVIRARSESTFGPSNLAHGIEQETSPGQETMDPGPSNRQDDGLTTFRVGHGSGPLSPYPSSEDAEIRGELRVFGRAAPGSLLDLGGYPYRVGPGGRFSFQVALDDPALLAALLARLPRLPVEEREPPAFDA
jgi:hypothetical protein